MAKVVLFVLSIIISTKIIYSLKIPRKNNNRTQSGFIRLPINITVMPPHCGFNLDEYLTSTVEKLNSGQYSSLHLVLGNESCDLDSAVCAIVFAAFLHWQHQRIKCKVCTRNKQAEDAVDEIFVPVLNVDREDYPVKTEVVHCFREQGVEGRHLVFRDDAALRALGPSHPVSATLVDHHVLPARDAALAERVTEIIDHRPIDKSAWSFPAAARVTIEQVGSCATLVTRRIADLSALFAERDEFLAADSRLADMLHSAIILDTVNFSPSLQKGTPLDEEMAALLEGVLGPADWGTERDGKLSRLASARADVSALTSAQLLRKDVKVEGDVLVPSLPLLVKEFLQREDSLSSLSAALSRAGCSAAVVLGIDLSGALRRDAAVYCPEEGRREKLISHLLAWTPSFDLSPAQSAASPAQSTDASLRYFSQHKLSASRKQYMPAIKHFLTSN